MQDMVTEFIEILHKTSLVVSIYQLTPEYNSPIIFLKDETKLDYFLKLYDQIRDKFQDKWGFVGLKMIWGNTSSYIMYRYELWKIDPLEARYMHPRDILLFRDNAKLLWGEEIRIQHPYPYTESDPAFLRRTQLSFGRTEAETVAQESLQFYPLIHPDYCWTRIRFTIEREGGLIHKCLNSLKKFKLHQQIKNIFLYGRLWGTGKTQILFHLMEECKRLKIPFIYRTELWRGKDGLYVDEHIGTAWNTPEETRKWLDAHRPANRYVLFLDEVDCSYKRTNDVFIISCGKELPSNEIIDEFSVFDLLNDFPFKKNSLFLLLQWHREHSKVTKEILPDSSLQEFIKYSRIPERSSTWIIPSNLVRAVSYALDAAIYQSRLNEVPPKVSREDAKYWATIVNTNWIAKTGKIHDVHCEYFVFNGQKYTLIDPFCPHEVP